MFDLTGAAASHLAVGDPLWHQFLIGGLLAAAFVSYALRPAVRVSDRVLADVSA